MSCTSFSHYGLSIFQLKKNHIQFSIFPHFPISFFIPGSSSLCWPWDWVEPRWAGRDVPRERHATRCRRCGARSSPCRPSWWRCRARWGISGWGYLKFFWFIASCFFDLPLLDWASSPTYESFCPMPTMTPWCLGRPTIEGKTALGASSPAKPALHMPDPLSTTRAATSSSHIFSSCCWSAGKAVMNLRILGTNTSFFGEWRMQIFDFQEMRNFDNFVKARKSNRELEKSSTFEKATRKWEK